MMLIFIENMKFLLGGIIMLLAYNIVNMPMMLIKTLLLIFIDICFIALVSFYVISFLLKAILGTITDPHTFTIHCYALILLEYIVICVGLYLLLAPILSLIIESNRIFFTGVKYTKEKNLFTLLSDLFEFKISLSAHSLPPEQLIFQITEQFMEYLNRFFTEIAALHSEQAPTNTKPFDSLELTSDELMQLIHNTPPLLSPAEETRFHSHRYEALKTLNTSDTPFYTTIPTGLDDTNYNPNNPPIILSQQYKKNNTWHATPSQTHVYLYEEIKVWYESPLSRQLCPLSRESLITPQPYIQNNQSYETRFIWHRYYHRNAPNGICQELNELVINLRKNTEITLNTENAENAENTTNTMIASMAI